MSLNEIICDLLHFDRELFIDCSGATSYEPDSFEKRRYVMIDAIKQVMTFETISAIFLYKPWNEYELE